MRSLFVPVVVAALGLAGAAHPLEERQSPGSPFSLYAYGDDINGLEVFYADGESRPICEWSTA